jgi:hypothetical protein
MKSKADKRVSTQGGAPTRVPPSSRRSRCSRIRSRIREARWRLAALLLVPRLRTPVGASAMLLSYPRIDTQGQPGQMRSAAMIRSMRSSSRSARTKFPMASDRRRSAGDGRRSGLRQENRRPIGAKSFPAFDQISAPVCPCFVPVPGPLAPKPADSRRRADAMSPRYYWIGSDGLDGVAGLVCLRFPPASRGRGFAATRGGGWGQCRRRREEC